MFNVKQTPSLCNLVS